LRWCWLTPVRLAVPSPLSCFLRSHFSHRCLLGHRIHPRMLCDMNHVSCTLLACLPTCPCASMHPHAHKKKSFHLRDRTPWRHNAIHIHRNSYTHENKTRAVPCRTGGRGFILFCLYCISLLQYWSLMIALLLLRWMYLSPSRLVPERDISMRVR